MADRPKVSNNLFILASAPCWNIYVAGLSASSRHYERASYEKGGSPFDNVFMHQNRGIGYLNLS
jgi:hypothetical protein